MSADNFYLIRKHPAGGFSPVMGFSSAEDYPKALDKHPSFPSVDEAVLSVIDEYVEYGVRVHPECKE